MIAILIDWCENGFCGQEARTQNKLSGLPQIMGRSPCIIYTRQFDVLLVISLCPSHSRRRGRILEQAHDSHPMFAYQQDGQYLQYSPSAELHGEK